MIKRTLKRDGLVDCEVFRTLGDNKRLKLFSYTDEKIGEGPSFKRYLDGSVYEINNGQLV